MTEQLQTLGETLDSTVFSKSRRVRRIPVSSPSGPIPVAAWEISALLLSTQDIERIVETIAREVATRLAYTSFVYQHDGQGVVYSLGAPARHSLTYRLKLGEDLLGELSITREKPFTNEDIRWLENQTGCLVYALHNALSCRQALALSCEEFDAVKLTDLGPVLPNLGAHGDSENLKKFS